MRHAHERSRFPHFLASCATASLILLVAAEEDVVPPPVDEVHVVRLGMLEIEWDGPLRIDTTRSRPVQVDTDQWSRGTEVTEVLKRSGIVRKGDVLVRLDTTEIDEAIKDATTALKERQTQVDISRQSRKIEEEAMATSLEQNVKAEERAQRDLKLFNDIRAEIQKQQQKMGFEQSGYYVGDQKVELEQLQAMYGDTTLADQTKDIVLQRAQRGLNMAERRYEHTKVNNDLWWKHTFPDRETDMNDSVRWKTQQLDHTRIRQQLTRIRWEIDKAQEQRSLDDLQERLDELEADREGLVVKAPIDGILTRIDLETGDKMGMNQSVAQVRDPSAMVLEGSIDAADLAIVSEGMKVTVEADAFPGLSLPGSVETIGLIGKPSGSGTSFSIEITLDGMDDRLRLGLACTAKANHGLRNVISVPNDAVHTADDRSFVMLKQGENTVEQDVVTGLGNEDSIEIVSGLKSGDKIVISTAKDED